MMTLPASQHAASPLHVPIVPGKTLEELFLFLG
jgi:hypothetical protein